MNRKKQKSSDCSQPLKKMWYNLNDKKLLVKKKMGKIQIRQKSMIWWG